MWFLNYIIQYLATARDWFWEAYLEVNSWISPFRWLAPPLYGLYVVFFYLVFYFGQFNTWLTWAADRIDEILSTWDIWSYFEYWFTAAGNAWSWVVIAPFHIWAEIGSWWTSTSWTVQSWIDTAIAGVQTLINQVSASLASLQTTWDIFWTLTWPALVADLGGLRSSWESFLATTLPGLINAPAAQTLINTTLTTWFPFYDELVQFWGDIREFFSDPEAYLVRKLETMLERFW